MTRYRHLVTDDNRKWWTLGAMCFALFMVMLDNTVVNVALPSIQREIHAQLSALEWVINGYTLTFAVLIATGGRLGDIFGRRRMFLYGVIIFAVTSATAGLAQDPAMLIGSRAIQGIGAALMMPATLSIITHAFPAAERGKAIGTWAGVSALALSIGPVIGGFLTEYVSWRAIFFINLPVAVGAVIATVFAVTESRDETVDRRVDYPGVIALTTALTAIILGLIEGNSWGWGSPQILALLAGGAIGLAIFVAIELRVAAPMVEFALFRTRQFIGTNLVAFIITFAMMGTFFFMALYMQDILGYSALEAGVRFLPTTMVIAVVAPISGRLADRLGPATPMSAGLAVLAVSMFMFAGINTSTTYSGLLIPFILMGTRDRPGDVADVDRRDERGQRAEVRGRLRSPADVPHGGRLRRRRRDRSDLPVTARQRLQSRAAGDGAGAGAGHLRGRPQQRDAPGGDRGGRRTGRVPDAGPTRSRETG